MKKNLTTLALVGVMSLGSIVGVYASTNQSVYASSPNASKAVAVEQSKEADEQELTAANTKTAITEEQAKQIALDSVKGGTFIAIELEDEDGVIVYGVEIQSGKNVNDVKVAANTGTVLKSDQDNDKKEENGIEKESKDNDNIEHENQNEDPAGYED